MKFIMVICSHLVRISFKYISKVSPICLTPVLNHLMFFLKKYKKNTLKSHRYTENFRYSKKKLSRYEAILQSFLIKILIRMKIKRRSFVKIFMRSHSSGDLHKIYVKLRNFTSEVKSNIT